MPSMQDIQGQASCYVKLPEEDQRDANQAQKLEKNPRIIQNARLKMCVSSVLRNLSPGSGKAILQICSMSCHLIPVGKYVQSTVHLCFTDIAYTRTEKVDKPVIFYSRHKKENEASHRVYFYFGA